MGNSMTKSELLAELYGRLPTFRERDCMDAAGVIIDTMSQTLVEVGRNPQDGSAVAVRARYTVFFKAGKDLRQRVDASRDSKL